MSRTKRETPRVVKKRNYLVSFRANAGLSQYAVAKEADIPQCRYNQIEAGKCGFLMNATILCDLAKALKIPIDTMCCEEARYLEEIRTINGKGD